mmetsp:Transcript_37368/g.120432  ORF Transcript_37368/g.120432 Transcript_37368/m.120432 type:complete len:247 (+) Transcript_37368:314-1054(+)
MVLAARLALRQAMRLANLAREEDAQLDGAAQVAQRRLSEVVHVVVRVCVHHLADGRLGARVQDRLDQLLVAADQVADRKARLGLHAGQRQVLAQRADNGWNAAALCDGGAILGHAQRHVAERRDAVGLHRPDVRMQQHRLHDGDVAAPLADRLLALVVAGDVCEEEARLLGHLRVRHVVRELADRQLERVHLCELLADRVGHRQARQRREQLRERASRRRQRRARRLEQQRQQAQLDGRLRVLVAL